MTAVEIYQKYIPSLKKAQGDEYKSSCPFPNHEDNTPSFFVNGISSQFYCFGCGRSGNIYSFLEQIGDEEQYQKVVELEKIKSVIFQFPEPISPVVVQQLHRNLINDTKKLEYIIRKRFISFFIARKYLLGYDPETDRYTIPIKSRNGRFINIKLHNSDKKPKSISWRTGNGGSRLYPFTALLKNEIVITEGEFDCLVLHSLHINAITCTTGAGTWKREWQSYFQGKVVRILFDSDQAGIEGARRVSENIIPVARSVKTYTYERYPILTKSKIDVTSFVQWGGDVYELLEMRRQK